jgi:hypothetical protein
VKVELSNNGCKVTRENGDPKIYSESLLLYRVKKELIRQGFDVIKKLMSKDGHLVDDTQQYIRERKDKFAIWFSAYALRFSFEDYNKDGEVIYQVEGTVSS